MSATTQGGKKSAAKILARDPDFFKKIGAKGGKNGTTGGFASKKVGTDGLDGKTRASVVGAIGGKKSRRGKAPYYMAKPGTKAAQLEKESGRLAIKYEKKVMSFEQPQEHKKFKLSDLFKVNA